MLYGGKNIDLVSPGRDRGPAGAVRESLAVKPVAYSPRLRGSNRRAVCMGAIALSDMFEIGVSPDGFRADRVLTVCWPCAGHALTMCWPCADHLLTMC